ncbi:Zinc finger protein [Drechslerella dactyloides]|uniref:Zinc finger protein n=1 Tax=Drechslerella dactyloides TaxID=74499 RepID=A0AAD6IUA5_DREDA|nr:Zinc finger protein [Drechslerella dactyloides]
MPFLENEGAPADGAENATTQTDLFQAVGSAAQQVDDKPDEDRVVDQIESLCMNCHENGTTRMLLISIPFFREVILMSFECPHCHFKNSEVQSAGQIQPRGVKYTFRIDSPTDLQRQVVKSDNCLCKFPLLDLEIPAQRGQLTTVEGLLTTVLEDLETDQEKRKDVDKETYYKIEQFLEKGRKMIDEDASTGTYPWTLELDDPSGNSWVQPVLEDLRGKWTRTDYPRTKEQNEALALPAEESGEAQAQEVSTLAAGEDVEITKDEVYSFPATCPTCTMNAVTNMKMVEIPHFQEVVIMSTVCDHCGYKSNEVKTGGAVPSNGRRMTLKVTDPSDLARDILKSESCALSIPEIKLDLTPGTLGGRFTTLEGLLTQVHDDLHSRIFSETSDSMIPQERERWLKFFEGLANARDGKINFTVVLEDPLAASYLQNLYAPDPDPNLTIVDYERTDEQNEDLGIADMKTEGYEADAKDES